MKTLLQAMRQDLWASSSGMAVIEFALAMPLLILMTFGGLELANFVLAHMRISQIAITVADNAGRARTGIDESNIYEVFAGANLIGESIDFADNGRIVLSSLQPNGLIDANAGQMINWQRCYGRLAVSPSYGREGAGRTDASLSAGMGSNGNKITSASGTAVMFVEVTYRYEPAFFSAISNLAGNIRYESAFNVRERTNQDITNTQRLTVNSC